jgi:hypothetical protein
MHGGLSPLLFTMNEIKDEKKPIRNPSKVKILYLFKHLLSRELSTTSYGLIHSTKFYSGVLVSEEVAFVSESKL